MSKAKWFKITDKAAGYSYFTNPEESWYIWRPSSFATLRNVGGANVESIIKRQSKKGNKIWVQAADANGLTTIDRYFPNTSTAWKYIRRFKEIHANETCFKGIYK